jgi:predicted site-specific integrase-resolvase
MKAIKLSKWAKENGYSYTGAYQLYIRKQLPTAYRLTSGAIMIPVDDVIHPIIEKTDTTVIYGRVSTPKQKDDLDRQIDFVTSFCAAKGWEIHKIYKEVASGLNDDRPQLNKILIDTSITRIVVSDKDRLTRFGFNYISKLLALRGCEVVVINQAIEEQTDLMHDFVSVITSMAARIYGMRRHRAHVEKILEEIKK